MNRPASPPASTALANGISPNADSSPLASPTADFSKLARHSRILMAVVAPQSLTVLAANATFCEALEIDAPLLPPNQKPGGNGKDGGSLAGEAIAPDDLTAPSAEGLSEERGQSLSTLADLHGQGFRALGDFALSDRLSVTHGFSFDQWYRRQVFCRVWASYHPQDSRIQRWLEAPQRVLLKGDRPREERQYFHAWLQSGPLRVRCRTGVTDPVASWPCDPDHASLDDLEKQFDLSCYEVSGWLFLEAIEVTIRERMHDLTKLLLNGESILGLEKFRQVGQVLRQIFQADQGFVLRTDRDQVQISRTAEDCPRQVSHL
ncbi:MAG: hypothetical protein AAGF75_06825, partial [Cyanobacteria bacterium P01_H01_bin.130]